MATEQEQRSAEREGVVVRSKNIDYLVGLDHLRALACTLIVLYHGRQQLLADELTRQGIGAPIWPNATDPLSALVIEGHTAVSLFMVLSAFIFTFGIGDSHVNYWRFLYNRFLRTYPLYLVVLLLGFSSYLANATPERVLSLLLGLANYNQNNLALGPFATMSWTIAIEWQFYLVFPILLTLMRPRLLKSALWLLLMAQACSWLAYFNGVGPRDLAYWTLVGRIDQFVIGMVAGYYFRRLPVRTLRLLWLPALLFALGSLFCLNRLGGFASDTPFKLVWPLWEGAMWAAFAMCHLALAPKLPRLASRALVGVGAMSYSVYLWHYPILQAVRARHLVLPLLQKPELNAVLNTWLVVLPIVFTFSALSYRVIEKPFMRLRVRYLTRAPAPEPAT